MIISTLSVGYAKVEVTPKWSVPLTGYGNEAMRYSDNVPDALHFEHGGYSVDRCRFIPGTGERLAQEYISILEQLHEV